MRPAALLALLLAPGCWAPAPAGPREAEPCERACANLAALGCEEAEPTTDGTGCVEVCKNVERQGIVSLEPECVSEAESCEAARESCGL